ncbi:MAG TPA: YMGG-like glycine zipper-containing protein [Pyrinomonadaceae bacterium]|nr:YMGG-like glycine zipper-containing protein [Pyrinomonadaceae bacterium]
MIHLRRGFAAIFALGLLCLSFTATAQQRSYRGTYQSVLQLIHRIEDRTDLFRNSLDATLHQSTLDGTNAEDNINLFVRDFDAAVSRLRERFGRRQSTAVDAQEVLNRAAAIDDFLRRRPVDARTQRTWANLRLQLNQLARAYNVSWPARTRVTSTSGTLTASRLTGTYRLDPARSDDPREAAERVTQNVSYNDRHRISDEVTARLESPDQLAIEVRGRTVTIASSRAPQITFEADGSERLEATRDGRTTRARATLTGNQLIVSSSGDRQTDFSVTFDPIDNGRRLSVTRRVYVQGLDRPVVVQSTYDRTADIARFDIQTAGDFPTGSGDTSGDFVVPDGETIVASLNEGLSTKSARNGQIFTATVRQPSRFQNALITGRVASLQRSGRITGRSEMTLTFDSIRLRDGRTYRFAGILQSVRTTEGDVVRVDNEGSVRDDNQTTKTAQRAAIGTAVGAVIGAIAGGGKGAAIGAILGAGGGAGSVYVQGRDDLELNSGTELTIRSTGPR